MPFKSSKQKKWMYANEPAMAEKWEREEKYARRHRRTAKKRKSKRGKS